jgi:hypothetical protein
MRSSSRQKNTNFFRKKCFFIKKFVFLKSVFMNELVGVGRQECYLPQILQMVDALQLPHRQEVPRICSC